MRLAIDCRFMGKSGIGTFIENVCRALIGFSEHDFLLIGDAEKLTTLPLKANCKPLHCDLPCFSVAELWRFPVADVNRCDAFFTPNYNLPMGLHVPVFAMIHDTVQLDCLPTAASWRSLIYKVSMQRALQQARAIFTVSAFSKARIQHHFPKSCPIHVVSNGIAMALQTYQERHPNSHTPEDFIVCLGNMKPHKGLDTLLDAYQQARHCPTTPQTLYVIGQMSFRSRDNKVIKRLEKGNLEGVIWEQNANNERVFDLLSHAKALIAPSRYEGFGIPPLEAMYLGTPAIISDIPAHREVYADSPALFFPTDNVDALAYHLCHLPQQRIKRETFPLQQFDYNHTAAYILNTIRKEIAL